MFSGNFWSKEVLALPGMGGKGKTAAVAPTGTSGMGHAAAPEQMDLAPALRWAEYMVPALWLAEYMTPAL